MMNNNTEILMSTYQAEDCLIGSILVESSYGSRVAINEVSKIITPEHFIYHLDRIIYTAMLSCSLAPHELNVAHQLFAMNMLEDGVIPHMCRCVSVTLGLLYMEYASVVKSYAEARRGFKPPIIRGVIV